MTPQPTPTGEAERLVVQWAIKVIDASREGTSIDPPLAGLDEAVEQYREQRTTWPEGESPELRDHRKQIEEVLTRFRETAIDYGADAPTVTLQIMEAEEDLAADELERLVRDEVEQSHRANQHLVGTPLATIAADTTTLDILAGSMLSDVRPEVKGAVRRLRQAVATINERVKLSPAEQIALAREQGVEAH